MDIAMSRLYVPGLSLLTPLKKNELIQTGLEPFEKELLLGC